jgi:hypothetical protein
MTDKQNNTLHNYNLGRATRPSLRMKVSVER